MQNGCKVWQALAYVRNLPKPAYPTCPPIYLPKRLAIDLQYVVRELRRVGLQLLEVGRHHVQSHQCQRLWHQRLRGLCGWSHATEKARGCQHRNGVCHRDHHARAAVGAASVVRQNWQGSGHRLALPPNAASPSPPTTARGRPAEVRVSDRFGNTHYLRAEPLRDDVSIAQGTEVIVLRQRYDEGYRIVALGDI